MKTQHPGRMIAAGIEDAPSHGGALPVEPQAEMREPSMGAPTGHPVVGVAGSDGAARALCELLGAVAAPSGFSYVAVPGLSAEELAALLDGLPRRTRVKVREPAHGELTLPGRIYLAPLGADPTLRGGRLRLRLGGRPGWPPGGSATDRFFASLAADLGGRAVGVVLSGTGDSGLQGLSAIVAAGGLTIAQDPATADCPEMPQAAIAAGLADLVLPPAAIPAALAHFAKRASERGGCLGPGSREDDARSMTRILALVERQTGHRLGDYCATALYGAIRRRMAQTGVPTLAEYCSFLSSTRGEPHGLSRAIAIGERGFFADPDAFEALRDKALGPLIAGKAEGEEVRVWVPGCGCGEEAYGIAMLLIEAFEGLGRQPNLRIFATDLDTEALERARRAVYPESASAALSAPRLARFFERGEDGSVRARGDLRNAIVFAAHNLAHDAPFCNLDLISCQRALPCFNAQVQGRIAAIFQFALRRGGILFTGAAGPNGRLARLLEAICGDYGLFRRGELADSHMQVPPTALTDPPEVAASPDPLSPPQRQVAGQQARLPLVQAVARAVTGIAGARGLACRLPDDGALAPLGETALTEPFPAYPDGLVGQVSAAACRALGAGETARLEAQWVRRTGPAEPVELQVRLNPRADAQDRLLLVSFLRPRAGAGAAESNAVEPSEGCHPMRQAEREHPATREELIAAVEELQRSNRELRLTVNEWVVANGELHEKNRTLQASNAALQAMNEALTTLNAQAQETLRDLDQNHEYIAGLLGSVLIGYVVLDRDLRIRFFAPSALELFNMRQCDLGRPLADLSPRLDDPDLLADCDQVLWTAERVERTVSAADGRHFLRAVQPYRTPLGEHRGVVITLTNVTTLVLRESELTESEERFRDMFENSPICLIEQDWSLAIERFRGEAAERGDPERPREQDGDLLVPVQELMQVTAVNAAARKLLDLDEPTGLPLSDLAGRIRLPLDFVFPHIARGARSGVCEGVVVGRLGREVPVLCQLVVMPGGARNVGRVLAVLIDITQRKALERAVADSEQRLRRAFQSMYQGAWDYDVRNCYFWWSDEYVRLWGAAPKDAATLDDWWFPRIHPDDRQAVRARLEEAMHGAQSDWRIEYRYRRADDSYGYVMHRGALLRSESGRLVRMLGSMLDISECKEIQIALKDREERLRSVLHAAADGIITFSAAARIESINPAVEQMFQRSQESLLGRPVHELIANTSRRAWIRALMTAIAPEPVRGALDHLLMHGIRGADTFPLEASLRRVEGRDLYVMIIRDLTERRQLEQQVIDASTIQQQEIGREIHDSLGQELTALLMLISGVQKRLVSAGTGDTAAILDPICEQLQMTMQTARNLARGLSPAEITPDGLSEALQDLVDRVSASSGVECRFDAAGPVWPGGGARSTHLYRIVQEALNNAVRHSRATRIDVSLEGTPDGILLTVRDNGSGLRRRRSRETGLGLRIMRYRANILGGHCHIGKHASGGTVVTCEIPVED